MHDRDAQSPSLFRPLSAALMTLGSRGRQAVRVGRLLLYLFHLAVGCAAGLVIAIMAVTGVVLLFAPQADSADSRLRSAVFPSMFGKSVYEVLEAAATQHPLDQVDSVTVCADRSRAVTVLFQSGTALTVNSSTGEVREVSGNASVRAFRTVEHLHRWLGNEGLRPVVAVCNVGCFLLVVSGLCLWLPRRLSRSTLRPLVWFVPRSQGRARDLNWHNVIGLWSAPVLLLLSTTGVLISYGWQYSGRSVASYRLSMGIEPVGGAATRGGRMDMLIQALQKKHPDWQEVTLYFASTEKAAGTNGDFEIDRVMVRTPTSESARRLHVGDFGGFLGQIGVAAGCVAACLLAWTGLAITGRRFVRKPKKTRKPRLKPAS